jgi:outer membrane protein assembly factor BamB
VQRLGVRPDTATRSSRFAATAWKVAAVLVLAAIAGVAIMLQVRGWSALENRSGGACGTGTGPCPRREVPGLIVSFAAGLFAVPVTVWALVRRPKVNAAVVVIGVAAGVFAGQALSGWAYGAQLRVDWAAPSSGGPTTQGVWTTSGSLIRVGAGQIVGYDTGTGRPGWTLAVPDGDITCAVSAQPTQPAVGLIGYGAAGGACDHLLAVDLGTGRQLWSRVVAAGWKGDQGTGFVAAGGDTAMVVTAGAVLGYDLRTGAPRWTALTPDGCSDQTLAAAQQSVVVLAACGGEFDVIDLAPASGKQLWRTPVPEAAPDYQFAILSADPVVVDDSLPGTPPADQVLAFGADGHLESTIPVGSVALDTSDYQGSGPDVVVSGGLFAGLTRPSGGHSEVVAFRLSDGRQQWLARMPDVAVSLRQDGNRLLVLDQSEPAPALDAIALSTGSLSTVGVIPRNVAGLGDATVYPVAGRYLLVNTAGSTSVPPVAALSGLYAAPDRTNVPPAERRARPSKRPAGVTTRTFGKIYAERPPSTGMTAPVRAPASGEQSQAIAAATSSGSSRRRSSAWPANASWDGRW